ncbi:hypothetical protein EG832_01290 [bacterium]|nr:hypothetical protein [bacterium]
MKPFVLATILFCLFMFSVVPVSAGPLKIMSLCDFYYPSDGGIEWECRELVRGDSPIKLFGENWRDVLRFNRLDRRHFIAGLSIKVPKRLEDIANFTAMPATYPDAAAEEKFILVDQAEMFLGAYEYGDLVHSFPVAVGRNGARAPNGEFRIDAVDRWHTSSLYPVEGIGIPYPMHYGLRFYVDKSEDFWTSYWIHGRDLPGYPVSHGCIGLYDEEMQNKVYKSPKDVLLQDAKTLYLWVVGSHADTGKFHKIPYGPRVLIIGTPPI